MAATKSNPKKEKPLRKRAEKLLAKRVKRIPKKPPEDTQKLIHELRVHQVELEVQNEELRRVQLELEESRDKYAELYDFAPVGYFTFDWKGRILEVNLTGAWLLGVERSSLLNKPFSGFVVPEFRNLFHSLQHSLFEKGAKETCELKLRKKDGSSFYVFLLCIAVQDRGGKFTECRCAVTDITERKKTENALQESQQLLKKTFASLRAAVFILDAETIQILDCNPAASKVFGYRREEMLGKTTAFLHVNEPKLKEFRRHLYDALEEKGSLDLPEFQMKRKNGEVFVTEHSVAPLKGEQGKRIGWVSVVRDISERKEMEDELRKSRDDLETRVRERTAELTEANEALKVEIAERRWAERELKSASLYARSLIEASLDPLVTINAAGKITDVNRATEMVTGVSRENLIGGDFFDYFTEPDKARAGYEEVFLRGAVRDYPLAVRHTSGLVTDVIYNATVYKNAAGEVQGVFASARDITERKQAEEELRRSEEKLRQLYSQLMAAQENERRRVARELHDGLQQLLAGIKFKVESFVQTIRNSGIQTETEPLEAVIPVIQESVREIRRIQMNLRPAILDDLGILATISWFCREFEAACQGIQIEKQIDVQEHDIPEPLKMAIYRIIQEGLTNITKHSGASLVHLSFRKTGGRIELSIQDNGQGFDLQEAFSVESARGGMGLVSMRERAEHSGGSFFIESGKGRGTVLRATWPL